MGDGGLFEGEGRLYERERGNYLKEREEAIIRGRGGFFERKLQLTSAVAPFPVSIVVRRQGAPGPLVVFPCATVVSSTFVDERERTTITFCCPLSASACKRNGSEVNCERL